MAQNGRPRLAPGNGASYGFCAMAFDADFEAVLRERAKAQLRKRMRALRATLPEAARADRSRKIVERVLTNDAFEGAARVGLFWPMLEKCEVDVRPLDEACRERNKRIFYPWADEITGITTLRECGASDLVDRGHGFLEPPANAPEANFAADLLVIVPALAVDGTGHRIGYGRGFYDRLLEGRTPPARSLAVAFDFQLIAEVPAAPHDIPVGAVATDARFLQFQG